MQRAVLPQWAPVDVDAGAVTTPCGRAVLPEMLSPLLPQPGKWLLVTRLFFREEAPVSTRGLARELAGLQAAQGSGRGSGAARVQRWAGMRVECCSGVFQDRDCGAATAARTLLFICWGDGLS